MVSKALKLKDYSTDSFSESEAISKIGRTVRLLADRNGVTKGVIGHVVDFHATSKDTFEVVVRWDLPNSSEPLHDNFSKAKYHLFISEKVSLELTTPR